MDMMREVRNERRLQCRQYVVNTSVKANQYFKGWFESNTCILTKAPNSDRIALDARCGLLINDFKI